MIRGTVISGEFSKVVVRQKSGAPLELGELLVSKNYGSDDKILLQVYDIVYGSQISRQNLELISGMDLEDGADVSFLDPELRNYNLAFLKPLISISGGAAKLCKRIPSFFSKVSDVTGDDLSFLTIPEKPLFVGNLRSGTKSLDVPINLPGMNVFQHHILIPATTGRGKSNLVKVMLWSVADQDYCGVLVLDPHDEYYGRNSFGLKDHCSKEKIVYYTLNNPPPGTRTLTIHIELLKPTHFKGVLNLSDPQSQAMSSYYREYGKKWVEAIIIGKPLSVGFHESTIMVLKRLFLATLNMYFEGGVLKCNGIFNINSGATTISDVTDDLERGRLVVVDTSTLPGKVELLVGSLISNEIFNRYKRYKIRGQLDNKPVISIVLEEAPRVLGKDALQQGSNIFSTIAREGRKFKVGLTAITQLPSLIPREILANMNTKIILGIEMAPERQAIIDSASQDLSMDGRSIASLDRGEAIVTSNFARFATPIRIPLFEDFAKQTSVNEPKSDFSGVSFK